MQVEHIAISFRPAPSELTPLGQAFDCAWPVEMAPRFDRLLRAIDEADRDFVDRESTNEFKTH